MEITPVVLKDVLYDMQLRTFYCSQTPLYLMENTVFSTAIPDISDIFDTYHIERPTVIMNYLHSCIGHAYVDITIPQLSTLYEYSPETLSKQGFQLFVLKDCFQESTTDTQLIEFLNRWEKYTVDFENGTYKGPYSHFHRCISDTPILFEKVFTKSRYIKFDTILYGGNMEFQRAIHNSAAKYPGRKLHPVASDIQIGGWISNAKEVFGKYIGIQAKTPGVSATILIDRKGGTRSFTRQALNKLSCIADTEPVYLEEYSFKEQIQMFKDANIIISAHGSGLCHLLWSNPGTHIIEIFAADDSRKGIFQSFSEFLGLTYTRIECSNLKKTTDEPIEISDENLAVIKSLLSASA